MIPNIFSTLYQMPFRCWQYGQHRPFEAIVYGLALAVLALFSKLFIAILATVAISSGIKASLH